ncbi:MAG: hypothetical protein L3J78_01325 [Thermoplasmata archaeon]|nr:hypothetical protein [Thermoplasmata archaeon]
MEGVVGLSAQDVVPSPDSVGKKPSRFTSKVVAGILIAVVLAAFVVSWFALSAQPPRVLEVLANGQFTVIVPLLTGYTFPSFGSSPTAFTWINITETEPFTFHWSGTARDGSAVRFVLRPNSSAYSFESDQDNEFRFRVLGGLGSGFPGPDRGILQVYTWDVRYVARRMAVYSGFFQDSWVEVRFTPIVRLLDNCYLPCSNVTLPQGAELLPAGEIESLNLSGNWEVSRSLRDFALPSNPFRHASPAVSILAGSAGNVTAILESSFHWGPGGEDFLSIRGSGTVAVSVGWYWDGRFGALYPVLQQPYVA